jgi:hypothetical protein
MMLIRMTGLGTQIAALLAAGAAATGGLLGNDSGDGGSSLPRIALVVDAAQGSDGRDLVDDRLADVDADVRLPRTASEALTNVRYFDAQDYLIVVAGPHAAAAAETAGVAAERVSDLDAGLAAIGR